jgi:ADP-ribosylglycohydrolase
LALEGLSVADALGGLILEGWPPGAGTLIKNRYLSLETWDYTDDTEMALSIYACLRKFGELDQGWLAQSFAAHYAIHRNYGLGAHSLIMQLQMGHDWQVVSKNLFDGQGSFGNGGAMRITPLGAYFADDLPQLIAQAEKSCVITHSHPEGVAGGIAAALGAAMAWRARQEGSRPSIFEFIGSILPHLPASQVKQKSILAQSLPKETSQADLLRYLGNGSAVSAQDTVPLCLWMAGAYLNNYEEAIWQTLDMGGDADTTAAIVGGMVALYTGQEGIPAEWIARREALPTWAIDETPP